MPRRTTAQPDGESLLTDAVLASAQAHGLRLILSAPRDLVQTHALAAIAELDDLERIVILGFFGLQGQERRTLREIEGAHGWKHSRASVAKARALEQLGRAVKRRLLPPPPPAGTILQLQDGSIGQMLYIGREDTLMVRVPIAKYEEPELRETTTQWRERGVIAESARALDLGASLSAARALVHPVLRGMTLAGLLPLVADELRPSLAREVLQLAETVPVGVDRARILHQLLQATTPAAEQAAAVAGIIAAVRARGHDDSDYHESPLGTFLRAAVPFAMTPALRQQAAEVLRYLPSYSQERIANALHVEVPAPETSYTTIREIAETFIAEQAKAWRRQGGEYTDDLAAIPHVVLAHLQITSQNAVGPLNTVFESDGAHGHPAVQRMVAAALVSPAPPPLPETRGELTPLGIAGATTYAVDADDTLWRCLNSFTPSMRPYLDRDNWRGRGIDRGMQLMATFVAEHGYTPAPDTLIAWMTMQEAVRA